MPGGQNANTDRFDGPSGVLVCCEDHIIWKHMDADAHRIPIPRRRNPLAQRGEASRGNIIVAAVMHKIKVRLHMRVGVPTWAGCAFDTAHLIVGARSPYTI